MEVIKVQLARTVWLFDIQELNSTGISLFPEVFNGFAKRYQFTTLPKPEEIHSGAGLIFKGGKFVYDSAVVDMDFDMRSDGLVASCRHSTEAAHEFLLDATTWLGQQIGVAYTPRLMRKRIYRDELIVQMDAKLAMLSQKLQEFSELLTISSQKTIQPTGILFGEDAGTAAILTIDRRMSTPWEENRYFSSASLQTA